VPGARLVAAGAGAFRDAYVAVAAGLTAALRAF
jgi:hypothetical protein